MTAAYRPGGDVGVTVVHEEPTVYLARLPDGPVMILEGVSALIWVEATTGTAAGLCRRVAEAVGEPEEHIVDAVEAFVTDLRRRGLIELVPTDGT